MSRETRIVLTNPYLQSVCLNAKYLAASDNHWPIRRSNNSLESSSQFRESDLSLSMASRIGQPCPPSSR